MSAASKRYLIVINDGPYGHERAYNALRLALSLVRRPEAQVRVYVIGDGVHYARRCQKTPEDRREATLVLQRRFDGEIWWRWTLAVTAGELLGFAIPALTGALTTAAGLPEAVVWLVTVPAGLGEGAVLGFAQWWVLRRYLPSLSGRAWVLATALAAGLAWIIGVTLSTLGSSARLSPAIVIALAVVLGIIFLLTMGGAQWWVLRRHLARAGWWIAANAIAWPVGVLVPVIALSLVPDGTPLGWIAVTGIVSGILMGVVVGAITGVALVMLLRPRPEMS